MGTLRPSWSKTLYKAGQGKNTPRLSAQSSHDSRTGPGDVSTGGNYVAPPLGGTIDLPGGPVVPGSVKIAGRTEGVNYTVDADTGIITNLNIPPGTSLTISYFYEVPEGQKGESGEDGADGNNAYTALGSQFQQPAVGANVSVHMADTGWMAANMVVYIQGAGYYTLASVVDGTHALLTNLGYPGSTPPGGFVNPIKRIIAAGIRGASGTGGSGGSGGGVSSYASLIRLGAA